MPYSGDSFGRASAGGGESIGQSMGVGSSMLSNSSGVNSHSLSSSEDIIWASKGGTIPYRFEIIGDGVKKLTMYHKNDHNKSVTMACFTSFLSE